MITVTYQEGSRGGLPTATYVQGSDLPDLGITWKEPDGSLVDFSTGYTFEVRAAAAPGNAALFTKTTGITGGAAPSVRVAWSTSGELNSLASGLYWLQVDALHTADGKQRSMQLLLSVRPGVGVTVDEDQILDGGTP